MRYTDLTLLPAAQDQATVLKQKISELCPGWDLHSIFQDITSHHQIVASLVNKILIVYVSLEIIRDYYSPHVETLGNMDQQLRDSHSNIPVHRLLLNDKIATMRKIAEESGFEAWQNVKATFITQGCSTSSNRS